MNFHLKFFVWLILDECRESGTVLQNIFPLKFLIFHTLLQANECKLKKSHLLISVNSLSVRLQAVQGSLSHLLLCGMLGIHCLGYLITHNYQQRLFGVIFV